MWPDEPAKSRLAERRGRRRRHGTVARIVATARSVMLRYRLGAGRDRSAMPVRRSRSCPWIAEEGVAVARLMDGRRHDDVAAVAAGIDAGTDPAGLDGTGPGYANHACDREQ